MTADESGEALWLSLFGDPEKDSRKEYATLRSAFLRLAERNSIRGELVEELFLETIIRVAKRYEEDQKPPLIGHFGGLASTVITEAVHRRRYEESSDSVAFDLIPSSGHPSPHDQAYRREVSSLVAESLTVLTNEDRKLLLSWFEQNSLGRARQSQWPANPRVRRSLFKVREEMKSILAGRAETAWHFDGLSLHADEPSSVLEHYRSHKWQIDNLADPKCLFVALLLKHVGRLSISSLSLELGEPYDEVFPTIQMLTMGGFVKITDATMLELLPAGAQLLSALDRPD